MLLFTWMYYVFHSNHFQNRISTKFPKCLYTLGLLIDKLNNDLEINLYVEVIQIVCSCACKLQTYKNSLHCKFIRV